MCHSYLPGPLHFVTTDALGYEKWHIKRTSYILSERSVVRFDSERVRFPNSSGAAFIAGMLCLGPPTHIVYPQVGRCIRLHGKREFFSSSSRAEEGKAVTAPKSYLR